MQAELFEPSGSEVLPLAERHFKKADEANRRADALLARGCARLAWMAARESAEHLRDAECLAMLAEFEHLAGIAS